MNDQKSKTILIVDDDVDYLLQQKVQLEAKGFVVITAEGQKQAGEILETTRPDLCIVDLMMEDMDGGFVLCYRIKGLYPEMPVILATAVTSETGMEFEANTREEQSWIKADAMLAKPFRFEQLMKEVNRLLG